MKRIGITLFVVVVSAFLIPAVAQQQQTFTGPTSKYYLDGIYVVQGPRVVAIIPSAYGGGFWEGAFAVSETIRTRASDARYYPPAKAGEYTLEGVPTWHTYDTPQTGNMRYYDGTTDGVHNYFVDHGQGDPLLGGVYITDYYWQSPRWLFYPVEICYVPEEGGCGGLSGIAYDPTNNSLWISARGNPVIGNYSLNGVLLSTLDTGLDPRMDYIAGLGVDPADHTLWIAGFNGGVLRQYSLEGATFGQLLQSGIPEGFPPYGSDSAEFQVLGCSSIVPGSKFACLKPASLDSGKQLLGTTGNPISVRVVNTGMEPLAINNIAISGDFTQVNNCPTSPAALSQGEFCTIKVRFTPTAINKRTGIITIAYNSPTGAQQLPLSGMGTIVTLLPSNVDFGKVWEGQESAPITVSFSNKSGATVVNIVKTTITGGGKTQFAILSNTCNGAISPLARCEITAAFKPTQWGKHGATLNVFHDGGGSQSMVSMVGTGQ